MKIHMTKVLRFWVGVEYERIKNYRSDRPRPELEFTNVAIKIGFIIFWPFLKR
jgi:hypothetical protein